MGQLTGTRILDAVVGLLSRLDSTDETLAKKVVLQPRIVTVDCHDSATAGTAFTKSIIWKNDTTTSYRVVAAEASAPVAVTANATNFASFIATKLDSAGANGAVVATFATDTVTTDDMVANVPKTMTLTVANVVVPAGSILVGEITKTASGVAVTAATSRARITLYLEPSD